MDGEHRTDILILRTETVDGLEIQRRQSRLPIVAMQNIRIKIEEGQDLHDAAAEECETLAVVIVAITAGTLEVVLVVYKVKSDIVLFVLENPAVLIAP